MFIVKKESDNTINWPVTVETATDGGKIKKFEFTGIFKRLNDDEREAMIAADEAAGAPDDTVPNAWKETTIDTIMKVMTGWTGVVDEDKAPLDFNRDNLRAAARSQDGISILRGITTALGEINVGARTKN